MKIFLDTSDLELIEDALSRHFISGITTSAAILADAPTTNYRAHIAAIIDVCRKHDQLVPVSVEVYSGDVDMMAKQAQQLTQELAYEGLSIKIPIGWDELRVVATLVREGIQVNSTCCVAFNQVVMAATVGARYITVGRGSDLYDAASIVSDAHQALRRAESQAEIIMGGIHHVNAANEAIRAGADIVALPPEFLKPMCSHRKTDEMIQESVAQFEQWLTLGQGMPK